jgi:type I restriction enzyme, S subunit
MVTPDVMKMSVNEGVALGKYLMYFFNSPQCKNIVRELAFGVTRLRIDLSMFKGFPIPLPPIDEQREIARRVECLFAFADRLEARLSTAQNEAGRLTPALLAKAFRGELVPQDPNDEPASVLLARISAPRGAGVIPPGRGDKRLTARGTGGR